ncbi:MAG TPA: Wzz/FepE/Etk N-terminal domain-containing protein, partial [Rhodothermales bacterium]|nr:Wzz/FepE/Etk N-terminal domain-containing protein [Rhodothermales bacterium]
MFLRQYGVFVLVVTLAVLAVAVAYAVQQTRVYTASALILLSDREEFHAPVFLDTREDGAGSAADEFAVLNHAHDLAMRAARRLLLLRRVPTTGESLTILQDL